jgi:fumarate reductase subunit D
MMRAAHKQPGYLGALLHRLSGIALAIFLPFHFLALATALDGAGALDSFLSITGNSLVKLSEAGLVGALALHMALGLRVLAIEFLRFRERTVSAVSACVLVAAALGLAFLFNAG